MREVDVIVIGSGQGGVPLAMDLSQRGKRVVLFERGPLGGTCVNFGCRPSKAMLASAHLAARGSGAAKLGVSVDAEVDFRGVMERVAEVARASRDGTASRLESAGVTLVRSEASFQGERLVTAAGEDYRAETIVINTGNAPLVPPIDGLEGTPYMTYMDFWELRELPPRLLILGGGYVGVELGQGMARLGSETHIFDLADRIISREEMDVSELITGALEQDGVRFHLGAGVEKVAYADSVFELRVNGGEPVQGEALLVAVGQIPNTGSLEAAAGGIDLTDRGFIQVDERFETSCPGVYAIGDVTGQPAFTSVSWEDYRRMLSILSGGDRRQGDRVLAYAFFTEPQVGRVGMTLEQAEKQGFRARAETLPMEWVAGAYLYGDTRGFYRLVIDEETDRILGATLVGRCAGEIVHIVLAHMEAGSTWQVLERSVHVHPTLAEGLPSAARLFED